jgi:Tfp pilus assembly PilM family ATPase
MVQLYGSAAGVTVRASAWQSFVPGDRSAWRGALSRALGAGGFAGRRVVVALPPDVLETRTIRIPASVPADLISEAASSEAAKLFPFPLSQAVVQCLPLGDSQGFIVPGGDIQREVAVLAAPRCRVDALVEDLDAAGVIIESLDAGPCAIFRASRYFAEPGPASVVLLDVGERQTQVVVGRGEAINFIKSIEVGGWHFDQAVARKLHAAPAEARLMRERVAAGKDAGGVPGAAADDGPVNQAVADSLRGPFEQLSRTLSLYLKYHAITFRGPGPRCLYLMGTESDNEMLRASIRGALGHTVLAVDPLSALPSAAPRRFDGAMNNRLGDGGKGAWAIAVGLGLKKLAGGRFGDLPTIKANEVIGA